ncbi:3-deoxy-D-manno-octulosonic acid transferase [Psychroflexus planctonicus]|uniref:3-deoxy-D-manno-octulosonic acid transferase n=1 Tax=Psychroflexus planctonicus TaxID=1526575 RepID=A0ABQ1SH85_9FLAO|nr:3-deoxy-D-manno-octulosonic acid transferase [Psychroflexus planctonicus]
MTTWISPKQKQFVEGRKSVWKQLKSIEATQIIWIHTASLGEYEQAVPVMKELKTKFPDHKLLVTFFSPSGFEVKKKDPLPDFVFYLPLDTKSNAKNFVESLNIKLAIFVKYEIWPNYLNALAKAEIPTYLISALFRKEQIYFKPIGQFLKQALYQFEHIFVQNESSLNQLKQAGFTNMSISGDTRYDRVTQQLQMDNQLDFMDEFKQDKICFVFGSSWPEDEAVFMDFINSTTNVKFVIAPHEIKAQKVQSLVEKLNKKVVLHSKMKNKNLAEAEVLVIDRIGLLSKIYAYADIGYVGGGMGNAGLHNILEPATFGVPIVIGKNFQKFPEAIELRKYAGLFSVENASEFSKIASKLVKNHQLRKQTGMIAGHFVEARAGATRLIIEKIVGKIG